VRVNDGTSIADKQFSMTIIGLPLTITSTWLLDATNGVYYSAQLYATGGQQPYTWSLSLGSAPLPDGLTLSPSGEIAGTATVTGQFFFRVKVTDGAQATTDQPLSLYVRAMTTPLNITTTSLPNATSGSAYSAFLQASGGQPPYYWGLALGSAPLPQGLSINASTGELLGTPNVTGTFYFIVKVNDFGGSFKEQLLSVVINPGQVIKPSLASPVPAGNGKFQFLINGVQGARYTIQMSSDLATWGNLVTTNAPSASFLILVDAPSPSSGYYRILVSQ
jgi:hypothetical protein